MIMLYLVRHGETVYNREERIQGHNDSPLTDLGLRQAEAAADRLAAVPLAAVYSSDSGRALATAEAIASRHNLPVTTSALIREAYLGQVQGLTRGQFEQRYPKEFRLWREDSVAFRPPGAERLEDVIQRCGAFLAQVVSGHDDREQIAVALHGGSLRGIICAAFGLPPSFYRCIHLSNGGLTILEVGDPPGIWLLNDTCHLNSLVADEEDPDNVQR